MFVFDPQSSHVSASSRLTSSLGSCPRFERSLDRDRRAVLFLVFSAGCLRTVPPVASFRFLAQQRPGGRILVRKQFPLLLGISQTSLSSLSDVFWPASSTARFA